MKLIKVTAWDSNKPTYVVADKIVAIGPDTHHPRENRWTMIRTIGGAIVVIDKIEKVRKALGRAP